MRIHRTDVFAIIVILWQIAVLVLMCGGIAGITYDVLARYCGVPWNSHTVEKQLLTAFLLEVPLVALGVYWFTRAAE